MAKRAAQGSGTIRKKTVTRNGKQYTYWEARITTGRDPGTGKQIQQSFSGKTQKEVREKMQAAAVEVNTGTYTAPQKMTVGQWLDIWVSDYLSSVKPGTVRSYSYHVNSNIKPAIGALRLSDLRPHTVQGFINNLDRIAPSSVRICHKVLHAALEKAVKLDYMHKNPSDHCVLPKDEPKAVKPLDDHQVTALLKAAQGTPYDIIIPVALFSGFRISEMLGLTWDNIDFENGTITVDKQLARTSGLKSGIVFATPKNGRPRTITPAPSVLVALKEQHRRQSEMRLKAGKLWNNTRNLVFTLEDGNSPFHWRMTKQFGEIATAAGLEGIRFHDLRHTYAVNAIRAGDDIKTIQSNLGHATAAFTLDRYGHFTERMKLDSAARMENFIKGVLNL